MCIHRSRHTVAVEVFQYAVFFSLHTKILDTTILPKSSIIAPGYNCTSESSNSNECGLVWTTKSWIQRFSPKSFCFKNCVCLQQNLGYNDFISSSKLPIGRTDPSAGLCRWDSADGTQRMREGEDQRGRGGRGRCRWDTEDEGGRGAEGGRGGRGVRWWGAVEMRKGQLLMGGVGRDHYKSLKQGFGGREQTERGGEGGRKERS